MWEGFAMMKNMPNLWRKNDARDNESKSFHILNCESLESIQIGQYCFSFYASEFELKNLPQLQSIQIGTIGNDSYNFISFHLWFEVLNWYWVFEWLDLPNLQSIINSKGGSFRWPYSVTAKETSEYWILIVFRYSKPSKCQAIWDILLCMILINFEYCLIACLIRCHS